MTLSPEDREAWLVRWREGRTGFHLEQVNPFLVKYGERLLPAGGERVFVPLCGKTLDIGWLLDRGHPVVGVELAEEAVTVLFEGLGLQAKVTEQGGVPCYAAGNLEVLVADLFSVDPSDLGSFHGIWDRAALIALRESDRRRYADHLLRFLAPGGRMLLCSLCYDQDRMDGPPFSVTSDEVRALYDNVLPLEKLEEKDVTSSNPRFAECGLDQVLEELWMLG